MLFFLKKSFKMKGDIYRKINVMLLLHTLPMKSVVGLVEQILKKNPYCFPQRAKMGSHLAL